MTQAIIIFVALFIGYKLFEVLSFLVEGGTLSGLSSKFSLYFKGAFTTDLVVLMLINTLPFAFLLYPFTDKNRHEYKLLVIVIFVFINVLGSGFVAYNAIFMPDDLSIINRTYTLIPPDQYNFSLWVVISIALFWILLNVSMILLYKWLILDSKNMDVFRSRGFSSLMSALFFFGFVAFVLYSIFTCIQLYI